MLENSDLLALDLGFCKDDLRQGCVNVGNLNGFVNKGVLIKRIHCLAIIAKTKPESDVI